MSGANWLPRQRPSRTYRRKTARAAEPRIDEQHIEFILAQLDELILKREYNEAAMVFCTLALHQRSIPEAIWRVCHGQISNQLLVGALASHPIFKLDVHLHNSKLTCFYNEFVAF
jgi:hypothetical protein